MSCEYCKNFVKNESCWQGFEVANLINVPLEYRVKILKKKKWAEEEKQFTCFCPKCYEELCNECIKVGFINTKPIREEKKEFVIKDLASDIKEFEDPGSIETDIEKLKDFPEMEKI